MEKEPLVSIIIPTYNRATRIIATLDSVCLQTYRNIEIIVVDDGSTDDTIDIINNYIKNTHVNIKIIIQSNLGAPVARNNGLKAAIGEFVIFFDSDDIMLPNRIRKQIDLILSDNSDCCSCGIYYNSLKGKTTIPIVICNNVLYSFIRGYIPGSTQAWMYKARVIRQINGYDEDLICHQDGDLTFRVLSLRPRPKVSLLPEPLTIFIDHSDKNRLMDKWQSVEGLASMTKYSNNVWNTLLYQKEYLLFIWSTKAYFDHVAYKYKKLNRIDILNENIKKYLSQEKISYLAHLVIKISYSYSLIVYFIKQNILKIKIK